MMIRYENECCSCATPAYPCLGSSCPNRNVAHYYCDCCGNEEMLYHYDNLEICEECLLKQFEVVEGSDW
jgi:hypothetical protein